MPPRYESGTQYRVSFGGPLTPIVKALIIANEAVFVIVLLASGMVPDSLDVILTWFALNPDLVFKSLFVWQLVTYMFLHSTTDIFHIVFNMLALFMFGCEVERVWGPRRFLRFYLLCGIGGGLLNCALAFHTTTVGASGAIFGVIVAYAMLFPTRTILFWGLFPLSARQFAMLMAAIELFSLGALQPTGVARLAHLGGALTGYILVKGVWDPRRLIAEVRWKLRRRKFRTLDRPDDR